MEVIHIAVPGESYVAAIYSMLLPVFHPSTITKKSPLISRQSKLRPPPPILKLIDQGEDILIDRFIGTGTVSLVTLII